MERLSTPSPPAALLAPLAPWPGGSWGKTTAGLTGIYRPGPPSMSMRRKVSQTGGLVGENKGVVIRSHETGNIVGGSYVGGLIGENDHSGQVTQSYAIGTVDTLHYGGGLIGYHAGGEIADDYATGTISGNAPTILGGLVGLGRYALIAHSYATGAIKFGHYQGGLAGALQGPSNTSDYWDTDTAGVGQGCGEGDCSWGGRSPQPRNSSPGFRRASLQTSGARTPPSMAVSPTCSTTSRSSQFQGRYSRRRRLTVAGEAVVGAAVCWTGGRTASRRSCGALAGRDAKLPGSFDADADETRRRIRHRTTSSPALPPGRCRIR